VREQEIERERQLFRVHASPCNIQSTLTNLPAVGSAVGTQGGALVDLVVAGVRVDVLFILLVHDLIGRRSGRRKSQTAISSEGKTSPSVHSIR